MNFRSEPQKPRRGYSPARRGSWWILLALLLLLATACGGGDADETPTATDTATPSGPTPTFTPSHTPVPPTPLPPTWTPAATLSPAAPIPTIEYTYAHPTDRPVVIPTYTPTPVPPSATPAGPTLIVTAETLNDSLRDQLAAYVGQDYAEVPVFSFTEGLVLIRVKALTVFEDPNSARELLIQAAVVPASGRIEVRLARANYTDDNEVYNGALIDNLLTAFERRLDVLLVDLYTANAGDGSFYVESVEITGVGLTLQTVTTG
jgi:hypothetical protein